MFMPVVHKVTISLYEVLIDKRASFDARIWNRRSLERSYWGGAWSCLPHSDPIPDGYHSISGAFLEVCRCIYTPRGFPEPRWVPPSFHRFSRYLPLVSY